MQVAASRAMQTYGMLVGISMEEERDARDRVRHYGLNPSRRMSKHLLSKASGFSARALTHTDDR